eukprot:Colp12_sorted_trinity150504_noHs@23463
MFGGSWPTNGEIDILEGVHRSTTNQVTLHTNAGCNMATEGVDSFTGHWATSTNCNVYETGNVGCGIMGPSGSLGLPFNKNGGGVYATEWTTEFIRVWFFPRNEIPENVTSGTPDPSAWGKPVAYFSLGNNCASTHFINHQIVFDLTFCGDWAGSVWGPQCPGLSSCIDYVKFSPESFAEAFWSINSLRIFQDEQKPSCTAVDGDPYSSGSFVACCGKNETCLGDWEHDGRWHYLCKPACEGKCSGTGQDPYASGAQITCCPGLQSCLGDWNHDGRWHYLCLEKC